MYIQLRDMQNVYNIRGQTILHDLTELYSLVQGVSFDLADSLYKQDAPKTTQNHSSCT